MKFFHFIASLLRRVFNVYEAGKTWSPDRTRIPGVLQDERHDYSSATRLEIVRKSQWFEKNDAIANRLAQIFEQFVAGPNGLQVIPTTRDESWNQAADESFTTWCNFPDLCSRMNFGSFVGMTAWRWFFDGEAFWLKTRGTDERGRTYPKLQFIASHRVGTPQSRWETPGTNIIDGVEVDPETGRPVAYWIDDGFEQGNYRRVEAREVIHIFEPSFPGAYRGVPMLSPVLNDIHDLNDLELFEMTAAKHSSAKTDVIETATGELSDEDIIRGTAGTDANGNDVNKYYERVFRGAKVLKAGDKYVEHVSNRPSAAVQWFLRHRLAKICAGVGIPVQLAFPESIQGTVERAELDIAAGAFRSRCSVLSAGVREAYIYVIGWSANQDRKLADKPGNWWDCEIVPPRAPNVDVGRNSTAMLAELSAGATTFKEIYGQLGKNWRRELRQRANEVAYLRSLGEEMQLTERAISDRAVETTATTAGEPNKAAMEPLNGAQITAAIDVMVRAREGSMSKEAASELLVGIGIERERAAEMVRTIPAMDTGAGDVAFKREVLKSLLSVPAAREAVYNALDVEDLVSATGLPPERGYEAPWIPVIAPAGQVVSGDVVKDPQGDVVGGDVEEGPETTGKAESRKQKAEREEETTEDTEAEKI